ncbi:MAG: Na+/H+ antiporter NhaA, partial [Planctomycetota bacterium]
EPLPLGIALGLFVGKQVGVVGCTALAIKAGWARRPLDLTWRHLYGAALLSGVGFTMSLFIGTLAFDTAENAKAIRIGVIGGSLLSGLAGLAVLLTCRPPVETPDASPADP